MKDKFLMVLSSMILMICVLLSVAFLTLMERKILGYIHNRKGPNKVGYQGLLQPFSDALKLFSKEQTYPLMSNLIIYMFSPVTNLFVALMLWLCMPFYTINFSFSLSFLYFLCISSLGVYSIMMAGWSSNSNYAMLGSIRSIAQTISYEVSMILILLSFLILTLSFSIFDMMKYQVNIWYMFIFFPLTIMLFISMLAETNRSPFDFAEGESELVSGFNVEYSSGGFAMIFLSEYASILFMSTMSVFLYCGANLFEFSFFMKILLFLFIFIWIRGSMPRYRYDKLMYLAWKSYLPVSLNFFLFYFCLILGLMYMY